MKTEIMIIIAFIVAIIGFLMYVMLSIKKNQSITSTNLSMIDEKNDGEIDFTKQEIKLYSAKNVHHYEVYKLVEFNDKIAPDNQLAWTRWLHKVMNKEEINKESVSLFIQDIFTKDRELVKITLKRLFENRAYIKLQIIPQMSEMQADFSAALEFKDFYKKMNSLALDLSRPAGTLICINFGLFDTLVNRYGTKIINAYIGKVYELIHDFKMGHVIIGHYEKDSFLIYKQGLLSQISIVNFCQKIQNHFQTSITLEDFNFDLCPYLGVLILGEFNKGISASVKNAYEATLKGIEKDELITYYDTDMEYKNKLFESWRYEVLNVMKKKDYFLSFYPVVSLLSGNIVAHVLEIAYSGVDIKDYAALYNSAAAYNLHNDLFSATLKKALLTYHEQKKDNTLLVFCEFRNLEAFEKIYFSNKEMSEVKVCLVLQDYDELNKHKKAYQVLEDLKNKNVSFAIVAHPDMQTTIYQAMHQFSYLVIPANMLEKNDERSNVMVRAILTNIEDLNLQSLVLDVANYAMAERVKELGIDFINGPLFDDRNDDIVSVRKIAKLIEGPFNKR